MLEQPQPIAENLWWVIPSKLAGVRQPKSEELAELQAAGIGAIVSVFHDPANLDLYEQAGIPHLWLPIAVDSVPSQAQMAKFQGFVTEQNRLGHAVAVHCSTGRHRTGTIIAAYLIGMGLSDESAMNIILEANPNIELPETQATFLREFVQEHRGDFKQTPAENSIAENLWWVIPQKLAGVRKPTEDDLVELLTTGIGAIVSVMDDPSNLDLYEKAKLPYLWLPTKGGTAPSQAQIQELKDFVDQQNQLGTAVAIHCTSGRRRTGTMLASYLIGSGLPYDQAMQMVLNANPDVELREAQTDFLKTLAGEP